MKYIISHVGYFIFFLLGAYLAFRGVEDFGLLLFGKNADASITEVSTRSVRVGKSGRGIQHYAKYEFTAADKNTYSGSGKIGGQTPPERGAAMPIRYLSFRPSVNAPEDDVLGTGVLLTIVGVFLMIITIGAWQRKFHFVRAPAARQNNRKNKSKAA